MLAIKIANDAKLVRSAFPEDICIRKSILNEAGYSFYIDIKDNSFIANLNYEIIVESSKLYPVLKIQKAFHKCVPILLAGY